MHIIAGMANLFCPRSLAAVALHGCMITRHAEYRDVDQIKGQLCLAGDTEDLMLLAVVAVTVGYGLRPEDNIDV